MAKGDKLTIVARMPYLFSRDFDNFLNLAMSPETSASFLALDQRFTCASRLLAFTLVQTLLDKQVQLLDQPWCFCRPCPQNALDTADQGPLWHRYINSLTSA